MQVEWYGQSTFRLTDGATTIFIDPFDERLRAGRARVERLATTSFEVDALPPGDGPLVVVPAAP